MTVYITLALISVWLVSAIIPLSYQMRNNQESPLQDLSDFNINTKNQKVQRFIESFNKSCCVIEINDCNDVRSRHAMVEAGSYDLDDSREKLLSFEKCLCSLNSSAECHLDFEVIGDEDIDAEILSQTHYIVFQIENQIRDYNCRIDRDATIKCAFLRKTNVPIQKRLDVEVIKDFLYQPNCSDICRGIGCVFQAENGSTDISSSSWTDNSQSFSDIVETCLNNNPGNILLAKNPKPTRTTTVSSTLLISTTSSVSSSTTTHNNGGNADEVSGGDSRVPQINGMVGGIVGGVLVLIILILAAMFYVARQRRYRTTSSKRSSLSRAHSVIQERLSDNVYCVMDDPVYQDPSSIDSELEGASNHTFLKEKPNNGVEHHGSAEYVNFPKQPTAPIYNTYDKPTNFVADNDNYTDLGPAPYHVGVIDILKNSKPSLTVPKTTANTSFGDDQVAVPIHKPSTVAVKVDSNGYSEPCEDPNLTCNQIPPVPHYLELQNDPEYLLAKGVPHS